MSFIINIDTAVETASVCLAKEDEPVLVKSNPNTKDSAAWLHPAIGELLKEKDLRLSQVAAIAVSSGPGSYTGLRVGMATAKGLCYALKIPLITVNTLQMMAASARETEAELLCPMIDARRMEVFAAVFDRELKEIQPSTNLVLDATSFSGLLDQSRVLFFGNGSMKFQALIHHPNAEFRAIPSSASDMAKLSYDKFYNGDFASLAYSEPFYGKDFHSIILNS